MKPQGLLNRARLAVARAVAPLPAVVVESVNVAIAEPDVRGGRVCWRCCKADAELNLAGIWFCPPCFDKACHRGIKYWQAVYSELQAARRLAAQNPDRLNAMP